MKKQPEPQLWAVMLLKMAGEKYRIQARDHKRSLDESRSLAERNA